MEKQNNQPRKMNLRDERDETESGMYLSMLADQPGEAEAAMILNSLVDDGEDLKQEATEFIRAVEKAHD